MEKDRIDDLLAQAEGSHVRVKSMSFSESKIVSIRNTSIYQDFRFSHLSRVGGPNQSPAEEADLYLEGHSLADVFLKEQPCLASSIIEEVYESPKSNN